MLNGRLHSLPLRQSSATHQVGLASSAGLCSSDRRSVRPPYRVVPVEASGRLRRVRLRPLGAVALCVQLIPAKPFTGQTPPSARTLRRAVACTVDFAAIERFREDRGARQGSTFALTRRPGPAIPVSRTSIAPLRVSRGTHR